MNTPIQSRRPRLAVFKFASCDGCQLQLVDILDEMSALNAFIGGIEIAQFLEVSSAFGEATIENPFDLAIVEGSISTAADRERIKKIRAESRHLITIGACATSGGIQALRNWRDQDEIMKAVYAHPEYIDTLRDSTAIGDHVHVDFELRGCPVNRLQLREVVTAFLLGKQPAIPTYSVCMECKRRGNVCVTVARGEPCLGPVTQAGCGAICPAYDRGCYGCFGAMEQPNTLAQANLMKAQGLTPVQIGHAFRSFAHTMEFDRLSESLLSNRER
ncbi:oxidoreductase [Candidatus Sumerlaeota bacterium]|nr:oxidoreductase [Candidatus Sumerlaeota bacterium]